MENHLCQWENPLFLWPFSIAMLVITREYSAEGAQQKNNHSGSRRKKKKIDFPLKQSDIPKIKIRLSLKKIKKNISSVRADC